jgi:hypothetical protein
VRYLSGATRHHWTVSDGFADRPPRPGRSSPPAVPRSPGLVLLGLLIVYGTVSQALRIPLGSVSVMMLAGYRSSVVLSGTWDAFRVPGVTTASHRSPTRPGRRCKRRDQEPGPTPLIGLRAGCNGLIALLLGLLAV